MGGKGDEGGGQQQDQASLMRQQQAQQAQLAAASQQKAATPVEEPKQKIDDGAMKEPTTTPTTTTPTTDNLTGLGDALVSGLSEGRMAQVADQTERVTADPRTYQPQFDPYTGTFTGQGPYNNTPPPPAKTGQV